MTDEQHEAHEAHEAHEEPDSTAVRVALWRALHVRVDPPPHVLEDEIGLRLVGPDDGWRRRPDMDPAATSAFRAAIVARARFIEDLVVEQAGRGVAQYVVLGAGLDTFAHRNPFAEAGLRAFEVDHPSTQAWKRERLAAAGLPPPASLTFAPTDFERQTLADGLAAAGFDFARPAVFAWLGVVIYLTRTAVLETLGFIAGLPRGTEVIFDYGVPRSAYPPAEQAFHERRAASVAARGEPWITRFTPAEIDAELTQLGFDELEDLGPSEIGRRLLGIERPDGPGAHVMRAARTRLRSA